MNEFAKKWIEDLRSGAFQQCRQMLRNSQGGEVSFCCLGVANEISGLGEWIGSDFHYDDGEQESHAVEGDFLALPVREKLGMKDENGTLVLAGANTSLAVLNDEGKTFAEIADIIEQNADQLFEVPT